MSINKLYAKQDPQIFSAKTNADGPKGSLPLTADFLRTAPSGNIFGMTVNAGMGWEPSALANGDIMIIGTQGGIRRDDGVTTAVGLHNGHFELGIMMAEVKVL